MPLNLTFAAIYLLTAFSLVFITPALLTTPTKIATGLFLLVLIAGYLVGQTKAGPWLESRIIWLGRRAGLDGGLADSDEVTRVNLCRIVVGLLLTFRSYQIAEVVFWINAGNLSSPSSLSAILMMVCALCLTFGILTPVFAFASTILFDNILDGATATRTLGTDVFLMVCLVFTFLPAGTRLSVDAWLGRRSKFYATVLNAVYVPWGPPSAYRSLITRTLALVSYGLLCIYSVLFHLQDPAWIEGFANLQALSSTFLSRNYTLIQDLYNWNPSVAIWLSRLTGWGMIFWEFFLIPLLVISRATRVFAIAWGLLFFTISLIFFNLSFLPYYEYVFWALLFFNRTAVGGNLRPLEVFFDDRCNLCDRTMRTILALDVFNVVQPRPVSKNTERLIEVGLSQRDALTDLYAWDESRGRLVGGFDFYLLLTQRVLILLPARFILTALKIIRIGPLLYRYIADRRTRLFGVCTISTVPTDRTGSLALAVGGTNQRSLFRALPWAYAIFAFAFIFHMPLGWPEWKGSLRTFARAALWAGGNFGISQINVFNENDLKMSSNFVVVWRVFDDKRTELVPYHGLNGERLGMDYSDRILYGISLPWRRSMKSIERACYRPELKADLLRMRAIADFDRNKSGLNPVAYRFDYYSVPAWDYEKLRRAEHQSFNPVFTCSATFENSTGKVLVARNPATPPDELSARSATNPLSSED